MILFQRKGRSGLERPFLLELLKGEFLLVFFIYKKTKRGRL